MKMFYFKNLTAFLFTLAALTASAAQSQSFICDGQIGNGFSSEKPEYRTYGNRSVAFVIQCNWLQRLKGSGDCTASINGMTYRGAYLGDGAAKVYKIFDPGPLMGGNFQVSTKFLFFQLEQGPDNTNQNYTQRWFNGFCREN